MIFDLKICFCCSHKCIHSSAWNDDAIHLLLFFNDNSLYTIEKITQIYDAYILDVTSASQTFHVINHKKAKVLARLFARLVRRSLTIESKATEGYRPHMANLQTV